MFCDMQYYDLIVINKDRFNAEYSHLSEKERTLTAEIEALEEENDKFECFGKHLYEALGIPYDADLDTYLKAQEEKCHPYLDRLVIETLKTQMPIAPGELMREAGLAYICTIRNNEDTVEDDLDIYEKDRNALWVYENTYTERQTQLQECRHEKDHLMDNPDARLTLNPDSPAGKYAASIDEGLPMELEHSDLVHMFSKTHAALNGHGLLRDMIKDLPDMSPHRLLKEEQFIERCMDALSEGQWRVFIVSGNPI